MERLLSLANMKMNYPTSSSEPHYFMDWGKKQGVDIDQTGIVIPSGPGSIDHKIVPSWIELESRILEERRRGKEILLLPGSYDLVHVGHLSYVIQAMDFFVDKLKAQCKGEQGMFTVVTVDDDALLREAKKDTYIRVTGKFGPIESGPDENGRHPRLDALASFPVDAVAFMPSPLNGNLPTPVKLSTDDLIADHAKSALFVNNLRHALSVQNALEKYDLLCAKMRKGEKLDFDYSYWSVELWQLYLHSYLNKEEISGGSNLTAITRVISKDDQKYLDIVQSLMSFAKIKTEVIDDVFCLSSKMLVKRYGIDELLIRKKQESVGG